LSFVQLRGYLVTERCEVFWQHATCWNTRLLSSKNSWSFGYTNQTFLDAVLKLYSKADLFCYSRTLKLYQL